MCKIITSVFLILILFVCNLVKADTLDFKNDSLDVFVPNIKVIGHSWAVGTFKNNEDFFIKHNIKIDEASEVGTSLKWAYEKLKDLPNEKYDAICILTGINDYKKSINYIVKMFSDILELAVTKASVVFIFNIAYYEPAEEMVSEINDWLNEAALLNPGIIVLVDAYNEIELRKKEGFKMSSNGLHPSSYEILQNLFVSAVQKHYKLK